jgi:hypothetical protein
MIRPQGTDVHPWLALLSEEDAVTVLTALVAADERAPRLLAALEPARRAVLVPVVERFLTLEPARRAPLVHQELGYLVGSLPITLEDRDTDELAEDLAAMRPRLAAAILDGLPRGLVKRVLAAPPWGWADGLPNAERLRKAHPGALEASREAMLFQQRAAALPPGMLPPWRRPT